MSELEKQIEQAATKLKSVQDMMGRRLVGQDRVASRLLMGLVSGGHVLLEGLPGLAKTTAVKALGDCSHLSVKRIQFTPDLLPADVIGTQIYDQQKGSFEVKKGPIFANLLIADEINRAPAKVQSALLEAMQEKQVTLADQTFKLPEPFLVMATQNPIEQDGTYPLPEAQVDRFLFKVNVDYTSPDEEKQIMERMASGDNIELDQVITADELVSISRLLPHVHVSDKIRDYIVSIVFATRRPEAYGLKDLKRLIEVGASPRASINLERAARVVAIMAGRDYVVPQDVKDIGLDVLAHRLQLSYEADADEVKAYTIVQRIFETLGVP